MLQRVTDPGRKTFGKFLYEHGELLCCEARSFCAGGDVKVLRFRCCGHCQVSS